MKGSVTYMAVILVYVKQGMHVGTSRMCRNTRYGVNNLVVVIRIRINNENN